MCIGKNLHDYNFLNYQKKLQLAIIQEISQEGFQNV